MAKRISVMALCLTCLTSNAFAQGGSAVINGTVFDQAKAVMPGVTVTVTNEATGISQKIVSDWRAAPRGNDLKPEMVAEATANARKAALEFARQSGSRLGGIRRASQGVFEILPRDAAPGIMQEGQMQKTLRVVATVEYLLK